MFFKKLETTQEACFHNTLGEKKITEHLVPIRIIITKLLQKIYKMTSSSKQISLNACYGYRKLHK